MNIGILGASTYEPVLERAGARTDVDTHFGTVSVLEGDIGDATIYHIRRFGPNDNLQADLVNHAAHAVAFRQLGVRRAINDLPADLDCQCQSTWSGAEDTLPPWYRAIR